MKWGPGLVYWLQSSQGAMQEKKQQQKNKSKKNLGRVWQTLWVKERVTSQGRIRWLEFTRQSTEEEGNTKRELHHLSSSFLSIQLNTDKHRHGRKRLEAGERSTQKEFGRTVTKLTLGREYFLFPSTTGKNYNSCVFW